MKRRESDRFKSKIERSDIVMHLFLAFGFIWNDTILKRKLYRGKNKEIGFRQLDPKASWCQLVRNIQVMGKKEKREVDSVESSFKGKKRILCFKAKNRVGNKGKFEKWMMLPNHQHDTVIVMIRPTWQDIVYFGCPYTLTFLFFWVSNPRGTKPWECINIQNRQYLDSWGGSLQ